MASVNPVLVLNTETENAFLEVLDIPSDDIPEMLNGESGFHIYHVRMLTELMLRELQNVTDRYSLSEEDIKYMSIASSLHDIGKSKIPSNILNFPGKLSPVEYDIVKKHTVLGYEMIEEMSSGIDERIIKHAKDIAKYHHERIDGTGYPEALKGENIPIAARVVSIADSFDALTSARSYKDAFSQDVAIEMIANGMSGVFDDFLVECLLNVVNDNDLLEIREQLSNTNRVVVDPNTLTPKRILLAGNTGYITGKFIEDAFENNNIIIAGQTHLKSGGKIKVYNGKRIPYEKIFETYDFDVVIFFARELTYRTKTEPDTEKLREILGLTAKYQKDAKVIYFSSLDGAYSDKKDISVITLSKENLCEFYTGHYGVDIKIVRIPHLYSGTLEGDFLHNIFVQMEKGTVNLKEIEGSGAFFVSMYDMSLLVSRFLENWQEGIGTLNVGDEFGITFGDIMRRISSYTAGLKVNYTGEDEGNELNIKNTALRNEYGWFSRISIIDDLDEEYEKYLVDKSVKATDLKSKLRKWIKEHTPAVKVIEIALMFIITEILNIITGSSVMFSIVDFRMAFIVIVATVHGLNSGLLASGLASLAWFIAKIVSGTGWLTIFYEPTNWFAFVYYFLVGAVTGYIRLTKDDKIKFGNEQIDLLEEKLEFTRELYQDTFNEKRDLKKQIIGSKDSFGKIFDVTRNLDTVELHRLYLKIMETYEETLENKTLSVYSIDDKSVFGRLEVASRDIMGEVSRSISLETYLPVLNKIKKDDIWKNIDFIPNLPMYATGVWRGEKLELLVFIWHVKPEQNSLYYMNLFKILCDLAELSLLRAHDYNKHLFANHYIQGTRILQREEFERIYSNFKEMAERKVFAYEFMEIDTNGHSYTELDKMLVGKIRANDILGEIEDGKFAILLSQATQNDLKYILPRFENLDIKVKIR
ncbi:MAG: HD domain-containing protein [Clostridia bacterium]|nr:HD domain-containing protein [Clostridia bacterium]